jgi:phenylpropionate dioxygenase-like ring-hydroxylating dioxygenase large terminal subunit
MTSTPTAPATSTPPDLTPEPSPAPVGDAAPGPWRRAWYPVAYLKDLDRRRPTAFTLLGEDLVLWWDAQGGSWRAFADVCPHRLVPLSEGRINAAGELECPYHGWSFAGDGHCTAIPQAPAADPAVTTDAAAARLASPRSRCLAYATAAAQGLLFVFAGDPTEAASVALPLLPILEEDPQGWLVQDTFRDLPYDALTLLENVLDVSHVPFTHHATVGRRENAGPVDAELSSFGPHGFTGVWQEGPRRGKLGSQFTTFAAPCLMWHDLTAKGFARILTVVYATPIRRGECRLFARFPFRFTSPWPARLLRLRPEWLQHIGNHKVLEDDQLFLHWQERVLEQRGGSAALPRSCFLATGADRYVIALHEWVGAHGEPFPGVPLPPRLGPEALMERLHSHTEHCRSCAGALGAIRRWRPLLLLPPWLALALMVRFHSPLALALELLVAAAAFWLYGQLGRWEQQLLQGDGQPPRNRG